MTRFWSPAEDEMLASLCGDLPWPKVVDTYNRWAAAHNLPKRTECAMRRQCERLHIQRRPVGEYINTGVVADTLGISYKQVQNWVRSGLLPSWRRSNTGNHFHYIRRKDLRRLARQRPELFGGQTESTLIQLLDSEVLAQEIAAMELPLPWRPRPVICVESGRRYESISAAARAVFVVPQRLNDCLDHPDRTAAGYHWKSA